MALKVDTLDDGNFFKEYFISVGYFYLSNLWINCTVIMDASPLKVTPKKKKTPQKRVHMTWKCHNCRSQNNPSDVTMRKRHIKKTDKDLLMSTIKKINKSKRISFLQIST